MRREACELARERTSRSVSIRTSLHAGSSFSFSVLLALPPKAVDYSSSAAFSFVFVSSILGSVFSLSSAANDVIGLEIASSD